MRRRRPAVRLLWYFWVCRDNEAETYSELSDTRTRKTLRTEDIFSERRSMLRHYKNQGSG
jgi:hypothetical protein